MPPRVRSLNERLWSRVQRGGADDCWPWQGPTTPQGYGVIGAPGGRGAGTLYVHRVVYEWEVGPIPDGLEIDHTCDNPRCCNPRHLEAVTHQANCERSRRGRKATCPHGHPLDGWRRHYAKRVGRYITHRYCKTCVRAANRKRKAAR